MSITRLLLNDDVQVKVQLVSCSNLTRDVARLGQKQAMSACKLAALLQMGQILDILKQKPEFSHLPALTQNPGYVSENII